MSKDWFAVFFGPRHPQPQQHGVPAFLGGERAQSEPPVVPERPTRGEVASEEPPAAQAVAGAQPQPGEPAGAPERQESAQPERAPRLRMPTIPDPPERAERPGEFTPKSEIEQVLSSGGEPASPERYAHLAYHDALTDLPNRRALEYRLEEALAIAGRNGSSVGIIFLDIDGFKKVNDTLGHRAGDDVLVELSNRMRESMRMGELIGRFGGDEFAAVYPSVASNEELASAANRLLSALNAPLTVGGKECRIEASMGIAVFPHDGVTASDLLQHADAAMYRAKSQGTPKICWYSSELGEEQRARRQLIADLSNAARESQLFVCYQPIVDVSTHEIAGLEAYLRWLHPAHGLLMPMQFLEHMGSVPPEVDAWVMAEVLSQMRVWAQRGLRVPVHVNLASLEKSSFTALERMIVESGIEPALLCLEIDERIVAKEPEAVEAFAQSIRAAGLKWALDAFNGEVNLSRLERLSVDYVKLSPQIVAGLSGGEGAALANAAVNVAKSFSWTVIATGVESPEQQRRLFDAGVHLMEGFGKGAPMTSADVSQWLTASAGPPGAYP